MAESHRGAAGDRVTSVRIVRRHVTGFAALTAVVAMAPRLLYHPNAPTRMRVLADPLLGGWLRWDGWWYVAIARSGYTYRPHHMSSVAFFPTYPLIVRVVSTVAPGGAALAAIATTLAAGSVSLVLLYRWCARRMSPRAANATVIAMLLILIALGIFIDQVSMMLITLPVFMPIVAKQGVDPIWFGVLFLICMQLGLLLPPHGLLLMTMRGVAPPQVDSVPYRQDGQVIACLVRAESAMK